MHNFHTDKAVLVNVKFLHCLQLIAFVIFKQKHNIFVRLPVFISYQLHDVGSWKQHTAFLNAKKCHIFL
ncbi:hypothetical protein EB796_016122 [Bugula neritina]|uniref:Uncharacterized protein n=1 Tax=Bugula neritina TaxID=10212 RepID=A0A7J7JH53_BUGNE|nr:hypothetical protein EB796_016122 [Bugula neritina]